MKQIAVFSLKLLSPKISVRFHGENFTLEKSVHFLKKIFLLVNYSGMPFNVLSS